MASSSGLRVINPARAKIVPWLARAFLGWVMACGAQAADDGKDEWFRYGNDAFEVVGRDRDYGHEEFAMRYAVYCDTFDSYFAREGWPKPRARIVFIPSREEFTAVMGDVRGDSGMLSLGGFIEIDGEGITVLNRERIHPDSQLAASAYLELDWRLRHYGWFLPPWVSQGIGAVFTFAEFRHRGALLVGNLPYDIRRWGEDDLLSWERFFAAGKRDIAEMSPRDRGRYWAQSWALVRWCIFGQEDPGLRLRQLVELTNRGASLAELESFFGAEGKALSVEVVNYAGNSDHDRFRFEAEEVDARLRFAPLSEVQKNVLLADVTLASGDVEGAAIRLAEATRGLERPWPMEVHLAQARQLLLSDQPGDALEAFREAVRRGTKSPFAWLTSAEERVIALEQAEPGTFSESERASELAQADREARQAILLEPSSGRAYYVLGRAALLQDEVDPAWFEVMAQRYGADVWGARVRAYAGILRAKIGQPVEAAKDVEIALLNPDLNPQERLSMTQRLAAIQAYASGDREQIFAAAMDAVNEKLGQGDVEAAIALVDRLANDSEDPVLREQFAILGTEIDANVTRQRVAAMIKRERWDEAEALANGFLERVPADSEFRGAIETLRDRAHRQVQN